MAIQSKYSNEQIEKLLQEVLLVLEQQGAPVDLSLMILGNAATHILSHKVPAQQRAAIAEQFAAALRQSVS